MDSASFFADYRDLFGNAVPGELNCHVQGALRAERLDQVLRKVKIVLCACGHAFHPWASSPVDIAGHPVRLLSAIPQKPCQHRARVFTATAGGHFHALTLA